MDHPTSRNRERILEAIDQLRNRKARPDIARICNYLFRRFHVNSAEAKADLEWCVDNNIVLKVEYKGNISYRNAAKKRAQMRKRQSEQNINKNKNVLSKLAISRNFMEVITNIFGELVVEEPDYLEIGVPPKEIMDNILSKDSERYTRNHVAILLVNEVERGSLIKLENGNFVLGRCDDQPKPKRKYQRPKAGSSEALVQTDTGAAQLIAIKPKKRMIAKMQAAALEMQMEMDKQENMDSGDEKLNEGESQRSGRRKKAKKVFDPSDTHIPKKRGRSGSTLIKNPFVKKQTGDEDSRPDSRLSMGSSKDQGGVCSVCHTQNKRGPHDRMVACRDCSHKAHYGCLNSDDMMLKLNPDNTWRCPHCKTCVECFETSKAKKLVVCTVCADAYHATCHRPEITNNIKKGQKWLCGNCQATAKMRPNDFQASIGEPFDFQIRTRENEKAIDVAPSLLKIKTEPSSSHNGPPSSPLPQALSPLPKLRSPKRESQSDSSIGKDSDNENASPNMHSERASPEIHNRNPSGPEIHNRNPPRPHIDPSIPDVRKWTPDQLYEYFRQFLTENEAKIFKEQNIDGRSFLLLRRIDVLTSLNLELGPALKVYRHLTMLQVRRDDKSLYWL